MRRYKVLVWVAVLCMLQLAAFTGYAAETSDILMGDANGDTMVLANDAMLVLQYSVRSNDGSALNLAACDMDGNGLILANDAMLILQKSVGMFPEEEEPEAPAPTGPTSSATCKDTGSNKIWRDPAADLPDYCEEKDPNRADYREDLKRFTSPDTFLMKEKEMWLCLGKTYGVPVCTSYETFDRVIWSSSDPSVATVNEWGFVVPLKEGETVISATYGEETPQTLQCYITVLEVPEYTYAQLEQMAKEEAKLIADYAMYESGFTTDLERIAVAAKLINIYVGEGTYTSNVPGYNQPFGTLVTFYSSCAGSTRAMGLVLEYMGFQWYHVNENQWDHQWCVVYNVDGKTAFADGSEYGIAGYGDRQEQNNWMHYENGAIVPFWN